MMPLDAVVLAGGLPGPEDPLYPETLGMHKALLRIGNKPMIQWVLDALVESANIRNIYVVGLPQGSLTATSSAIYFIDDQGGMIENLKAGVARIVDQHPDTSYFLAVSSDIPALRPHMVDDIIQTSVSAGADIFFNVIERTVMRASWPGIRRTYMRFADGYFCAADLHVISTRMFAGDMVHRFIAWRKSPLRLMGALGPLVLIQMLMHRLSLQQAVQVIESRTGISARALPRQIADIGMDVDHPAHLAAMRHRLVEPISGDQEPTGGYGLNINMQNPVWPVRALIHSGDSVILFPLFAVLALIATDGYSDVFRIGFLSMAAAALACWFLKHLIKKERPAGHYGKGYRRFDPYAFPSGHAARSLALSTSIWIAHCDLWIASLVSIWALSTSLIRVQYKLHDAFDILGGIGLGIVVGALTSWWMT